MPSSINIVAGLISLPTPGNWPSAISPRPSRSTPSRANAYIGRAHGLTVVMLGKYQGAVADAEVAPAGHARTPEMMHNIACIFAWALRMEKANDRQAEAERYRLRALGAIQQTLEMVPLKARMSFWQDKIMTDPALAPLHGDARFDRLKEKLIRSQ